jgi:diguanylate cyclase (GGDEF)-like protein
VRVSERYKPLREPGIRPLDLRLATLSAAALYGAGALLLAGAAVLEVPSPSPRWETALLAGLAAALCGVLAAFARRGRSSPGVLLAADLTAVGLVAALVALSDGAHSPYSPYLVLPALHAAVFLPLRYALITGAAALAAFLAPAAYDSGELRWFAEVQAPALVPGLVIVAVAYAVVTALREERQAFASREAEVLRIAESDPLTGIGNYRRFWQALRSEAARARRHAQPFSLVVLDLDGFKAINDELGHQAGDRALRTVARALTGQVRTEDVVCRQGGDEFAVIAVAAGPDEASELSRRLVDAVSHAARREVSRPLTASAGWATFGEPEVSPEGLLARADRALLDSKRAGRRPAGKRDGAGRRDAGEGSEPADRRLAVLSACSRALALAPDEQALVQAAVAHVADALRARSVELWRRPDASSRPVLVAHARHPGGAPGPGSTLPARLLEEVMADHEVRAFPDGTLLVPVSHAGRSDAVLVTSGGAGGPAGLEEGGLAQAIASEIGRALAAASARAEIGRAGPEEVERLARATGAGEESARVAELAVAAGRELGLGAEDLEVLRRAARLREVGMIGVPEELTRRPGPLSADEARALRAHPVIAERLLKTLPSLGDVARVVRHASECFDGGGYPDGLAGEQVPLLSRVLHAAVSYAAMCAPRPWRPPMSEEEARAELRRVAGSQLDPAVVDALLSGLDGRRPLAAA